MKQVHLLVLLAVLVLALVLRLSGLGWGLPDGNLPAHRSSNRPDENGVLLDTLAVLQAFRGSRAALAERDFYVQEGWLGSYLRLGFLGAAYLTRYIGFDDFANREIGGYELVNFRRIFLVCRLVSALASVGTVCLVYIIGASHWGQWQGVIAALLLAISPAHVVLSHFAKSNALAALLATASLHFALEWYRGPSRRLALLAGACAGLAGGARTNALLAIVALGIALVLRWRTIARPLRFSSVALAAVGALVGVGLSYPHLIANPRVPGYGSGEIWYPGFEWAKLGQVLWLAWGGWPGIILLTAGVLVGAVRSSRHRNAVYMIGLGWGVTYCALVAKTRVPQARYLMPVLPTVALLAAVGLVWGLKATRGQWLTRAIGTAMVCFAILMLALSAAFVNVLSAEDTKVTAGRWLASNAPPGSVIGKPYWEGGHYVPVDTRSHVIVYSQPHHERYDIVVVDESGLPRPDFIVVPESDALRNQFDMEEYDLVASFSQPLAAFGIDFDGLPVPGWDVFHSTVFIYQRRARDQAD